jgi:hypothetical protein
VANIAVGNAKVRFSIRRSTDETIYTFSCRRRGSPKSERPLTVILEPLFPLGTFVLETTIDEKNVGRPVALTDYASTPRYKLSLDRSATVRIKHRLGIALVVDHPHLIKGERSEGLRLVDERWKQRSYNLVLEGRQGREYLTDVYDPSESIKGIEGGIALARDGARLLVSIQFPGGTGEDSYARKSVRFAT